MMPPRRLAGRHRPDPAGPFVFGLSLDPFALRLYHAGQQPLMVAGFGEFR